MYMPFHLGTKVCQVPDSYLKKQHCYSLHIIKPGRGTLGDKSSKTNTFTKALQKIYLILSQTCWTATGNMFTLFPVLLASYCPIFI